MLLRSSPWLQGSDCRAYQRIKHHRGLPGGGCCSTFLLIWSVTSGNTKLSHGNLPLVFYTLRFYSYKTSPIICPIVFQVKKEIILNYSLTSIHESSCMFNIHSGYVGFFFTAADNGGTAPGGTSGIPPSNPAGNSKSAARSLGSSAGEKEEGKKVRRQWESWSTEDKNTFFEGLYEVHVEENNRLRWLWLV